MVNKTIHCADGHTLIELAIAMGVLAVGMLALMSSLASTQTVVAENQEYTLAYDAVRLKLEEMRGYTPYLSIYPAYRAGGAKGNTFTVPGLAPQVVGGTQGLIAFPESGSPAALRENITDTELGMPAGGKDLNGSGTIDALSHSADYTLLPVKVTVSWTGIAGARSIVVSTWIVDK